MPPLFAGNPVNYSKINKLTTVEAISAALFILGFDNDAKQLLGKFKWGHTFYDLNKNLLDDYSKLQNEQEIPSLLKEYGIVIDSEKFCLALLHVGQFFHSFLGNLRFSPS